MFCFPQSGFNDCTWLAEIPILDLMTKGRTKKEAYRMVADMLETMVNKEGFNTDIVINESAIPGERGGHPLKS